MATTDAPVPVRSPLSQSLAGRTAVILGGSSGIGLAAGSCSPRPGRGSCSRAATRSAWTPPWRA